MEERITWGQMIHKYHGKRILIKDPEWENEADYMPKSGIVIETNDHLDPDSMHDLQRSNPGSVELFIDASRYSTIERGVFDDDGTIYND